MHAATSPPHDENRSAANVQRRREHGFISAFTPCDWQTTCPVLACSHSTGVVTPGIRPYAWCHSLMLGVTTSKALEVVHKAYKFYGGGEERASCGLNKASSNTRQFVDKHRDLHTQCRRSRTESRRESACLEISVEKFRPFACCTAVKR